MIIPDSWAAEAANDIAGLDCNQACYTILPVSNFEKLSPAKLKMAVENCLKRTRVNAAVVFLPPRFSTGKFLKYWPSLYYINNERVVITSVYFASCWKEYLKTFDENCKEGSGKIKDFHVTCQYQPSYTNTLLHWENAGAKSFHPGDFFKMDFLKQFQKINGHWLYWGHADCEKLRGYDHLYAKDLIQFKPTVPLQLTAWFSCTTLDARYEKNIALDWYLSGSTQCLLAASNEINTIENQKLGLAWLQVCSTAVGFHVADLLQKILTENFQEFKSLLLHYKLLGNPWVRL